MKNFSSPMSQKTRAGRRAMVTRMAFAIILGSFHLETSRAFPRHSLRPGSRAVSEGSPEARRLFRWRPPMDKTGAQKRARVGGKVECGALRLGRGGWQPLEPHECKIAGGRVLNVVSELG
jgi:hypothetical protein